MLDLRRVASKFRCDELIVNFHKENPMEGLSACEMGASDSEGEDVFD